MVDSFFVPSMVRNGGVTITRERVMWLLLCTLVLSVTETEVEVVRCEPIPFDLSSQPGTRGRLHIPPATEIRPRREPSPWSLKSTESPLAKEFEKPEPPVTGWKIRPDGVSFRYEFTDSRDR